MPAPIRELLRSPTGMRCLLGVGLLGILGTGAACSDTDPEPPTTEPVPATTEAVSAAADPVPSTGCEGLAPGSNGPGSNGPGSTEIVEQERFVEIDGDSRRYLVTAPGDTGDEPLPVVFDFHGLMEGADIHSRMTEYSALALEEGFIVVFPEGSGDPLHWNVSSTGPNADLELFDAVLAGLGDAACVDTARVYATGLSNGAMFTSLLICERSEVLAAAVPVAGLLDPDPCTASRSVPVRTYHGTADPILLFNGGIDAGAIPGLDADSSEPVTTTEIQLDGQGYPEAVRAVAQRNGCAPDPTDQAVTDEVILRRYDCPDGADVEFWIIEGGGHSWPSSEFSVAIGEVVGPTTFDVDATREGWEFMSGYSIPQD